MRKYSATRLSSFIKIMRLFFATLAQLVGACFVEVLTWHRYCRRPAITTFNKRISTLTKFCFEFTVKKDRRKNCRIFVSEPWALLTAAVSFPLPHLRNAKTKTG
jgi:hypothetical protein